MQDHVATHVKADKPLWRRIVDYPLVAMLIATAIYIAAVALGLGLRPVHLPLGPGPRALVHAIVEVGIVLVAYKLVIVRLGEHPRDDLRSKGALRDLGLGLLAGFLIFSAIVALAAIVGVYRITGPGDTSRVLLELTGTAILPGFMEELLFRGILFRWIEEFAGSWAALVVTSALFGLAHILNPNATWFSSFAIAVEAGVLLGGAYMLTRSLWFPMGLHAAWNFTQGEIFDVPVSGINQHGLVEAKLTGPDLLSGGQFGLEASILALFVATAVGIWIVWLAVRRGELVQPRWSRRRISASPTAA
ncbi:MAG TPA: type II CAAX endopeptidase family protein [Sphingomicrobium sp.]|nr:type II CAAX endopeptidase family protein [Sphingomicrobium sp.]